MKNRITSAGTAAQQSSKSSWLARLPLLLAIPMLCAVFSCQAQTQVKSDSLRLFYFIWFYNDRTHDAWGENDVKLNHLPSKKEIIAKYVPHEKGWIMSKVYVQIQEVTEEQLHEILSPENMKNKQMQAYYRAIYKN